MELDLEETMGVHQAEKGKGSPRQGTMLSKSSYINGSGLEGMAKGQGNKGALSGSWAESLEGGQAHSQGALDTLLRSQLGPPN